jgi:hypothetical protein
MALSVRTVEYFYTRVENEAAKAYELLATLASEDINLLAFSAVPFGANHVELTIFPDQSAKSQPGRTRMETADRRQPALPKVVPMML